jgi:hypothetical protein
MNHEITRHIKQIIPLAPGWTYAYLVEEDGKISVGSLLVTGQALVDWFFPREDEPEQYIEAIVFDDGGFHIESDIDETFRDGVNTFPIGLRQPGQTVSAEEVKHYTERFRKKLNQKAA